MKQFGFSKNKVPGSRFTVQRLERIKNRWIPAKLAPESSDPGSMPE
jgi:hypothetical protein